MWTKMLLNFLTFMISYLISAIIELSAKIKFNFQPQQGQIIDVQGIFSVVSCRRSCRRICNSIFLEIWFMILELKNLRRFCWKQVFWKGLYWMSSWQLKMRFLWLSEELDLKKVQINIYLSLKVNRSSLSIQRSIWILISRFSMLMINSNIMESRMKSGNNIRASSTLTS